MGHSDPPLCPLQINGRHIIDKHGRIVTLRGFSVSGSCKLPSMPDLPTHSDNLDAFIEHRNVSFVGRPFPLSEADEHLARLKSWGANFLRIIVPWEALEHTGPGSYDDDYIAYLHLLLNKMPRFGILCIIDSHQDVWSRLCGGSGAPGWTLELAGFNLQNLHDCCAAFIHAYHQSTDTFKQGAWPTGYQKLAAATMFTLFWTGDELAPKIRINPSEHADGARLFRGTSEVGIGTFLRRSHAAAYGRLASALQHCEALIGFEPMNEPHRGYLGLHSFDAWDSLTDLEFGQVPSALQSFALGDGRETEIPIYARSFPKPTAVVRHQRLKPVASCWRDGCLWRKHNVWAWNDISERPVVLRRGYFQSHPLSGCPIEFYADCWWPFIRDFAAVLHAVKPSWFLFVGGVPGEMTPCWPRELQPSNLVYAPHFYDLHLLFSKYLGNISINVQGLASGMSILRALYFGRSGRHANYLLQLGNILRNATQGIHAPIFLGETGLPYDINASLDQNSFEFGWHEQGLDAIVSSLETLSPDLGFAIWCYDPVNTRQYGDGWMGEDFSCISKDAYETRFVFPGESGGARCLDALQRPYVLRTAGLPIAQTFDIYTLAYTFSFRNEAQSAKAGQLASRITWIYLPQRRYEDVELVVNVSDGTYKIDMDAHQLLWTHHDTSSGATHQITLRIKGAPVRTAPPNISLSPQLKFCFLAILSVVLALLC